MSKTKELKNLIWFYFVQQKVLEILSIPLLTIIPYLIGVKFSNYFGEYGIFLSWWVGIVIFGVSILLLAGVVGLIYLFIKSNWNWAKRRAEKKLQNGKTKV